MTHAAQQTTGAARMTRTRFRAHGPHRTVMVRPSAGPPRGILLALHGCGQSAEEFARITGFDGAAGADDLLLIFPEQDGAENAHRCWNWFRPRHQGPETGEPADLMAIVEASRAEFGTGGVPLFVAGFSAGAAMALVLRAAFPDRIAACVAHSGVGAGQARSAPAALDAMSGGGRRVGAGPGARVPTLVIQGRQDPVVHGGNADRIACTRRLIVPSGVHRWFTEDEDGVSATKAALDFCRTAGAAANPAPIALGRYA